MMQGILDLARVFGFLFLTGIPAVFVAALVSVVALNRAKKRAARIAQEAGVDFTPKPAPGPSVLEIEGAIYCIGIVVVGAIIVIAAVLGVSLPLEWSEDMENIVGTAVSGFLVVLLWAIVIWSPYFYKADRRRIEQDLEEALSRKDL